MENPQSQSTYCTVLLLQQHSIPPNREFSGLDVSRIDTVLRAVLLPHGTHTHTHTHVSTLHIYLSPKMAGNCIFTVALCFSVIPRSRTGCWFLACLWKGGKKPTFLFFPLIDLKCCLFKFFHLISDLSIGYLILFLLPRSTAQHAPLPVKEPLERRRASYLLLVADGAIGPQSHFANVIYMVEKNLRTF